jgi:hypothetical protein
MKITIRELKGSLRVLSASVSFTVAARLNGFCSTKAIHIPIPNEVYAGAISDKLIKNTSVGAVKAYTPRPNDE